MARARVLSFMSTFGAPQKASAEKSQPPQNITPPPNGNSFGPSPTPSNIAARDSPAPLRPGRQRASSRPMSMIGGYQPPLMEIASDTIPELAPVFTYLNSHSNKLYQEGYFLKLNDLDSHGRPYPDRSWIECFAQLSGTVLSLWDAAALDAAGEDGEVAPTFINLADASIKMIETLPTRSQETQPLNNVLSISTAGKNRYLFHFSNVNALTQWTASIRLAMFENSSLQEAYTGSLIAGKGKTLNNIRSIMGPTRFKTEEWTRVRFGAGTPWRRCWCVISPPDEKEIAAYKKQHKKKSAYNRSLPPLKGNIKFYDTSKTKKVQPIATIQDAYSAYSIYPQSKPLIEQSTLIKIEGTIAIHTRPETTAEGFVFVMPEVRPMITGFEMMLRFLFPIYDVFQLYGRPSRLAADTLDTRSLMFAMPQNRRYGYLEIFDVVTLIHSNGSQSWTEMEWKKQMKHLTSQRVSRLSSNQAPSRAASGQGYRNSMPSRMALRFAENGPNRSTPSLPQSVEEFAPKPLPHTDSAPPGEGPFRPPTGTRHHRSASESVTPAGSPHRRGNHSAYEHSRLPHENYRPSFEEEEAPPLPPVHGVALNGQSEKQDPFAQDRSSSDSEHRYMDSPEYAHQTHDVPTEFIPAQPPGPVMPPPAFSHQPGAKPPTRPNASPELRRANSRMSSTTLSQLAAAGNAGSAAGTGGVAAAGAAAAWGRSHSGGNRSNEDRGQRVNDYNNLGGSALVADGVNDKGMVTDWASTPSSNTRPPHHGDQLEGRQSPSNGPLPPPYHLHAPPGDNKRSVSPLSQSTVASYSEDQKQHDNNQGYESNQPQGQIPMQAAAAASSQQFHLPQNTPLQQQRGLPPLNTRQSIARKPVARTSYHAQSPNQEASSSSDVPYKIDETAFNRVSTMRSKASTEADGRRYSGDSSHYGDSVASPDYASTIDSATVRREQAPNRTSGVRTGVLKTVGIGNNQEQDTKIGDMQYQSGQTQAQNPDDWNINFGPTHLYKPEVRKSPSPSALERRPIGANEPTSRLDPAGKRSDSPSYRGVSQGTSTSRANLTTPEPGNSRPPSNGSNENRRSVVWQPGGAQIGSSAQKSSITAEEYVQQRAAGNRITPNYSHNRSPSGTYNTATRQTSRTPPLASRQQSGDWSGVAHPSPPARPHSRGAASTMNITQNLSAREQEHVSRVTGSPLISLAGNSNRPSSQGGLVAAIEEREREKKDLKSGTNKLVKQAISKRQQPATQNYGHTQPTPPFHMPGQFPPSPGQDTQAWSAQWNQGGQPSPNYGQQRPFSQTFQMPSPNQWNQGGQQSPNHGQQRPLSQQFQSPNPNQWNQQQYNHGQGGYFSGYQGNR